MADEAALVDPSFADLRAALATPVEVSEPEPEAAAPEKPTSVVAQPEADSEPAEKQPTTEDEEPLAPSVQKRIAKEVERTARAQRAIDEAISKRKQVEAEAEKLAKPGSEPVKSTAPASNKPVRPKFGEIAGETWANYQDRITKYEDDRDSWLRESSRQAALEEFKAHQAQAEIRNIMAAAVKEYGSDFPDKIETVKATAPQGLQQAIGAMDNWAGLTDHFAKNPSALKDLVEKFATNQYQAIATLGRIEAGLKSKATREAAAPLPEPPSTPGGRAASNTDFNWEAASISSMRRQLDKLNGKGRAA